MKNETQKIPFSSSRKRQTIILTIEQDDHTIQKVLHIKGAAEIILESCIYCVFNRSQSTV